MKILLKLFALLVIFLQISSMRVKEQTETEVAEDADFDEEELDNEQNLEEEENLEDLEPFDEEEWDEKYGEESQ